jgi:hypothetical protein
VILPGGEVGNVVLPDLCGQILRRIGVEALPCLDHLVVDQAEREEPPPLFCDFTTASAADLELYPGALHAAGTQHEQQFVMDVDRLINLFMEFPTALDIVWREPDTEPRVLQAPMQTAAECFISAAVADKAGIELEGLAKDGWEVLNQRFWQPTAPEKGQGERPGFGKRAMVEDTGA